MSRSERQKQFERAVTDPLLPALKVGAATGTCGLLIGCLTGTLRSAHPALFAAFSGLQWFGLGSTFWYSRSFQTIAHANSSPTRSQELVYSTNAGIATGVINGAFRSRSHILPASLICGLLGLAGQHAYNKYSDRPEVEAEPFLTRISRSKWIPLRSLPDHEYEQMLSEKLLATEAEIALIDEKIAVLHSSSGVVEGESKAVPVG